MSIHDPQMDYEPDETERAVLDVIRDEGRVNPLRVRETTDIRKQYVNDALRQLQKAGVVRKVNRGLYEHVPENDANADADPDDVDLDAVRAAIVDIRTAYEDVDGNGVGDALGRAEELLGIGEEERR